MKHKRKTAQPFRYPNAKYVLKEYVTKWNYEKEVHERAQMWADLHDLSPRSAISDDANCYLNQDCWCSDDDAIEEAASRARSMIEEANLVYHIIDFITK